MHTLDHIEPCRSKSSVSVVVINIDPHSFLVMFGNMKKKK